MSNPSKLYLTQRNNGIYYVGYFVEGKKLWKSTGARLKRNALNSLRDFEKLLRDKPKQCTLEHFSEKFETYAKNIFAHRTFLIYRGALTQCKRVWGNPLLSSLSPHHLDQFKTVRLSKNISPVTVNIELRTLKAAMNTAVRWKFLEVNPFAQIQSLRVPDAVPTYFSKQDFQRLLDAIADEWLKELVVFAVLTGMRRGELINLRWQDVDLQRKLIHIQSNPTFKTKQGKRRVVPMSEVVFNLLLPKAQRVRCEYIFHIKGFKIYDDHASKALKMAVTAAGLNGKLHFHSLRHTFASWLVQDGVSLYEVQKLLGHSNIAVTQVYSHLQPEGLHSTVNRLNLMLN